MIGELDNVVLERDIPRYGLTRGDIGTVVLVHEEGRGYEIEFTALDGNTIAVVTLSASEVRAAGHGEIAHARGLTEPA